jgi:hypothetical protein
MEFYCEDLPQHGVVLVPPSSPEYDTLLADIRGRLNQRVAGSPPIPEALRSRFSDEDKDLSAILLNRGHCGIAAIQQIWTFEESNGRKSVGSIGGGAGWNPSLLLPFGIPAEHLKLYGYWHVILPGSKRYLNANGEQAGDNSDVRPPAADEVWVGGIIGGRAGGRRQRRPVHRVTLTLDGVFFVDGGFAGPNREHLWDMVVQSADIHMQVANMARRGRNEGLSPERILTGIERITGASPDAPPIPPRSRDGNPDVYRDACLRRAAWTIGASRRGQGDERTILMLCAWADALPPRFYKL